MHTLCINDPAGTEPGTNRLNRREVLMNTASLIDIFVNEKQTRSISHKHSAVIQTFTHLPSQKILVNLTHRHQV